MALHLLFLFLFPFLSTILAIPSLYAPSPRLTLTLQSISQAHLSTFKVSTLPLPTTSRAGLTYDLCEQPADCQEGLLCVSFLEPSELCPANPEGDCICRPEEITYCELTDECPDGELCTNTPYTIRSFCVSAVAVAEVPSFIETEPLPLPQGSLTFDRCLNSTQCDGDRNCIYLDSDDSELCEGRSPCVCVPKFFQYCFHQPDCETGEVCAEGPLGNFPICFSSEAEDRLPSIEAVSVPEDTQGFTVDPCVKDDDCKGARVCFELDLGTGVGPCEGSGACSCWYETESGGGPEACDSSRPCEEGEVCAVGVFVTGPSCVSKDIADAFKNVQILETTETEDDPGPSPVQENDEDTSTPPPTASGKASPSPFPSRSPIPEPACIDAGALRHLPVNELVYSTHAVATVLCDEAGSCATGGHVVVWRGRAMMMSSYCDEVECSRRIMQVNSLKYGRRKRVNSKTEGLEFTVFAARYESRAEEAIIAAAVRVGL